MLQRIADNIKQVAQDLVDFVLKSYDSAEDQLRHKRELTDLMEVVQKAYNPPVSRLTALIYWMTRTRNDSIHDVLQALKEADKQLVRLDVIAGFLQKGECFATSANTTFLNGLLAKLSHKYEPLESDPRFSQLSDSDKNTALTAIRLTLRDNFVRLAQKTLEQYQEMAKVKAKEISDRVPEVKKLNMAQFQGIAPVFQRGKKTPQQEAIQNGVSVLVRPANFEVQDDYKPRVKLDRKKFGEVFSVLNDMYAKKTNSEYQLEVERLNNISDDVFRLERFGLFANTVKSNAKKVGKVKDTYKDAVDVLARRFAIKN